VRSDFGGEKVPRLSWSEEWIASNSPAADQKDRVGGGCRHGVDSKSGKREGGLSDRASRAFLGEFGFGPKDEGEKDSGGEEIGSGDLLLASSVGRTSGIGEFDRAIEGLGVGEVEKKKFW